MAGTTTTIIADLTTASAISPSITTAANALAAAGPIMDVQGNVKLLLTKAQEMRQILNYILGGTANTPLGGTSPSGGVVTTGGDNTLYGLLAGVFNDLV